MTAPADEPQFAPDARAVPEDVLAALDRMREPLHESRLSATVQEDERCMNLIRQHILAGTPKPLDDPRLQTLFSDAIEGALALGYQNISPPPAGHWLWRFWNIGRFEAALVLLADRQAGVES